MRIDTAAKKQKLLNAMREDVPPNMKAKMFVRDVIVIDGPACAMPTLILCSTDSLSLV